MRGAARRAEAAATGRTGTDGARLSKRQQGITIRELRARGLGPADLVGRLAHLLGLRPTPQPIMPNDLLSGFSLTQLPVPERALVVDVAKWETVVDR